MCLSLLGMFRAMIRKVFVIIIGGIFIVASCDMKNKASDQPGGSTVKRASIAEIEAGIKSYIQKKADENDGFFEVSDRGKDFRMKLVRVHTEYLASLGPKSQFACVDLVDEGGDVYDVDFFLKGQPGAMDVTQTSVHKLNGKPYYAWKQREDKTWNRVPVADASSSLLGVIEGSDSFVFTYQIELPEIKGKARIWIPIASTDNYQSIEILSVKTPIDYKILKDNEFDNSIMYLELTDLHSKAFIEIKYNVTRLEKASVEDPRPVDPKYLAENLLMPVGGRFLTVANEATMGRNENAIMTARALYDYIIDNMRYMKYGDYGNGDSVYACDMKTGNCTEFHSFFISLARSSGIPARFAVGAAIPSERDEGGIDGYHCWAEFYAEGKWWPVDISEANKYTALATYYFGHHPANRIEFSRGRDLMVEPGPASGPVNFLAYPVLEINGQESAAKTIFSFKRSRTPAL